MGTTYRDELAARVRQLWQCVTELTVIVFEDRPQDVDLIAVDELSDRVSDLQGLVHDLQQACVPAGAGPGRADQLDLAGDLLQQASVTYWRDLRTGRPLEDLSGASRRRHHELNAWAQSLAVATAQCEEPLLLAATAWRKSWPELLHDPISTVEVRR